METMTNRRMLIFGLAVAAVTAIAAPMASAQDLTTVRIGVDPYTTGAQIWVAKDKGYFEKYGIRPEITTFATGIESLDAALTGRTDIGVGLDFPTALRMQSRQLTILAAIFASTPGWHKLAVSDAIKSPADLAGKSYGIATGTAQHLVTVKYLENNGVAEGQATLVPFASLVEIVASLKAGRLDGAFVWADGTKQATDSGFTILTDDSEAKLNQSAYVSANSQWAQRNPQAVVNVLKAMAEATEFLNSSKEEAAEIIAANTKAPVDSTLALLQLNEFKLQLTDAERSSFATIADFASDVLRTPVDFETAVDPKYLEEAVPGSVTLSN
jgi:NitT/TauT family transport system substrate-binding protein